MIVAISIIFVENIKVKGMLIIFILITYLFSCLYMKPYQYNKLNILSIISTLILIISCGILLNMDGSSLSYDFGYFLDILTIIINITFMLLISKLY